MLIDHPDLKPKKNFEYYFVGESSGKYCQFTSDRELTVGSIIVIDDYLVSTHIFRISSIEEVDEKYLVQFEDFQVALCSQKLVKYDV